MKTLHLIRTLDPERGGPVELLRLLAHEEKERLKVFTLDKPGSGWWHDPDSEVLEGGPGIGAFGFQRGMAASIREAWGGCDAAVIHGLWHHFGGLTRKLGKDLGKPYYVIPHGMLDPFFRRQSSIKHGKKLLYWWWVERAVLRDARSVIFTSQREQTLAENTFWPKARYRSTVIPLGVPRASVPRVNSFDEAYAKGRRYLLFLGRIDPKKGCDLLIEAWREVRPPMTLVVAGPGLDQPYGRWIREKAQGEDVIFPGFLRGELKAGALAGAEALILPSHQENYGLAVAEALAAGTPVLLSDQVNIAEEVATAGAGLVAPATLAGTIALIKGWLSSDQCAMREAARRYFEEHCSIGETARRLRNLLNEDHGILAT